MNDITTANNNSGGHHGGGNTCGPQGPGCENMIYLGKLSEMDVNERSLAAEGAPKTLGGQLFGSDQDPLFKDLTQVTLNDKNNDGVVKVDNTGPYSETITHSASGTSQDYKIDTSFTVKGAVVTVLNDDGTTSQMTMSVRIMQDTGGNTFLMPPPEGASPAEIAAITSKPLVSVTFPTNPACYELCYTGVFTDRTCFPCFAKGTRIRSAQGDVLVEMLAEGTEVLTADRGLQPLRWIGSRKLSAADLQARPELRPIRISAGALGKGTPFRDLIVSPQHRILVRSQIAMKMFGALEVLVAAKQLLQVDGIDIAHDLTEVEYFHFLFDHHEVVLSEGAETESLYTGIEALRSVGFAAREEIFTLFPQLRDITAQAESASARLLASGRMGRKLSVRHVQNKKHLV